MKLLLCSDFSGIGFRYLKRFFKKTNGLNCLFIGYANEEAEDDFESSAAIRFNEMGINVISLCEGYDFSDKIDIIFVRGGNTTKLIHHLRKFNQYEIIKKLVEEQDIVYIGNSAGSVLVGTDTSYTLKSEPYQPDLKPLFGDNALEGFGWIDKMVFVHCNKFIVMFEKIDDKYEFYRIPDTFCYPAYLEDKKIYKRNEYLKINNNQAYYVNGEKQKMLTYNWSHLPIKSPKF